MSVSPKVVHKDLSSGHKRPQSATTKQRHDAGSVPSPKGGHRNDVHRKESPHHRKGGEEKGAGGRSPKDRKDSVVSTKKKTPHNESPPSGFDESVIANDHGHTHSKRDRTMQREPQSSSFSERIFGMYKDPVILKTAPALQASLQLGLTEADLQKLKHKFDIIDSDRSGVIEREEFMKSLGEPTSSYTDKLFQLIDSDNSGTIDFEEFIRVLATYCIFSKVQIMRFCFECFDPLNSGFIDEQGFVELCKYVNKLPPGFPNNFRTALKEFDTNLDGFIDFHEFVEFERRYPVALFPAFRLQQAMQRRSLGEGAWIKIMEVGLALLLFCDIFF